ncbi:hypothetical protein MMC07_009439 [Pseudocyphellaria aurata]|nr:hypothetical protein [Pseudocyphellaria aurata]
MEGPISHHFPSQHLHNGALFHPQSHHNHPTLVSQLDLDPTDPFHFNPHIDSHHQLQHLQQRNAYEQSPPPSRFHEVRNHVPSNTQQNNVFNRGGEFGVLTPHPQLPSQPQNHQEALGRLQNEIDLRPVPIHDGGTTEGHFSNLKMVPDPPNLEEWRKRLFNVDEMITLTEDEFQTYFPHVDNIYSHRSTQRYKRKPFVSHYWDCRLKGRPPGTPKSEDPNKKKRKRQARERDLCDVKIKITEFFPGARAMMGEDMGGSQVERSESNNFYVPGQPGASMQNQPSRGFGMLGSNDNDIALEPAGSDGSRYYTIQRVNGNGGNGKGDGTAGPHKHSLQESDRVKKNSIARHFLKLEKVKKKTQIDYIMSDNPNPSQKTYHKKATGAALSTIKKHSKEHELKLFGSCFCPFVQRVWISMEIKGINYQYLEVDPYKKPQSLLEVNPRGLVPALRHGDWGCYESTVLMEYLEDLADGTPLLPSGDPKARAYSRLWSDHINRNIIPSFYRYLQCQEPSQQADLAGELRSEIAKLIDAADSTGPFFLGSIISFVDIQIAPWIIRMRRVLKPYRGWPEPDEGSRWARWVDAIEQNEGVKATTSGEELYLDSYERYAGMSKHFSLRRTTVDLEGHLENRPDTSQLAKAVNAGRGLP